MPVLTRFRIVKPRLERARIEVKPYSAYSFGNAFPEPLFNTRVSELHDHVHKTFPFVHPILDRLALGLSILGCVYMILFLVLKFMFMNTSNNVVSRAFPDIPNWTLLVLLPIIVYLGFYIWLKWRTKRGLKNFETSLNALLKKFNGTDITAHSIRWIYRRRIKRRTGQVRMSIYVLQGETDQSIATLPLYREEYDDSPLEEGGPPCYDDVMALSRVETGEDGWFEGITGAGIGEDSFDYSRQSVGSQVGLVAPPQPLDEIVRPPQPVMVDVRPPESVMVEIRGQPPGYRESV